MRKAIFAFSLILAAIIAFTIGGIAYQLGAPGLVSIVISLFIFAGTCIASYSIENKNVLMMACGRVSGEQEASCTDLPTAGTEIWCYLINRAEIDKTLTQFDGTNPMIITDLIMTSGTFIYKFEGYKNGIDPEVNANKGRLLNNWIHGPIKLVVIPNSPDGKTHITNIAKSNLCMIVVNKKSGVDGQQKFELYGYEVGLELSAGQRKQTNAETQGMWDITLSSPEGEFEPFIPYTIWDTNETTTLAQIEALRETT